MQKEMILEQEEAVIKKRSQLKEIWRRFRRNKQAMVGMCMLLLMIFSAIFASVISPYDPLQQDIINRLQPPSAAHFFGTDELGRDIFSRILYGSRISLTVGLIANSSFGNAVFLSIQNHGLPKPYGLCYSIHSE